MLLYKRMRLYAVKREMKSRLIIEEEMVSVCSVSVNCMYSDVLIRIKVLIC